MKRPAECESCGFGTKKLKFWEGQGRADNGKTEGDDVPWTLASHWLCRLCATGLAFEIHQGRVSHGIAQALNVMLETLESSKEAS